jgi:hypothetical protein
MSTLHLTAPATNPRVKDRCIIANLNASTPGNKAGPAAASRCLRRTVRLSSIADWR